MNLQSLTLRQLVRLHNEHVPEGRRVKTFQTKPIALKRVAAALPKPRLGRALGVRAPVKTRSPSQPVDRDKAMTILRRGCTVTQLAAALGVSERKARGCIDRLRLAGHKVVNVGPSTFKL